MFYPLKELRLKYQSVQENWSAKTPTEKWHAIHDIADMISRLVGIHAYSDLKVYWYSASCGILGMIYILLNIYTVQYYLRRGEFVRGMQCTYLVGMSVAVSSFAFHDKNHF